MKIDLTIKGRSSKSSLEKNFQGKSLTIKTDSMVMIISEAPTSTETETKNMKKRGLVLDQKRIMKENQSTSTKIPNVLIYYLS